MNSLLHEVVRGSAFRLCVVVWVFGYVLVELAAEVQGRSAWGLMFAANLPLLALGVCQSVGLGLMLDRLEHRPAYQRWGIVALCGVVAGAVQTAADDVWLRTLALTLVPSWQSWAVQFQPQRLTLILILYTWTIFLTVALIWAARTADSARMNAARAAAFEAAASRAEAAALRLQLNPHFLFNTLNSIASLVVRRRDVQAEEMIGRLGDFLRSAMASNPAALIPLEQEVATIRAYLTVEEARFGDRLRAEYHIAPELADLPVPNFILQPLVENAIKHGAAHARGQITITIVAREAAGSAILSVENRGSRVVHAKMPNDDDGAASRRGIGLANTRQRLKAQYGDRSWLECGRLADGYRAEMSIPLTVKEAAGRGL